MKRIHRASLENAMENHFQRVYTVVRRIPRGRVASYGRVALIAGGVTARMVGYAMAALPYDTDVPWHRVINSKGRISLRADGDGDLIQRAMLEAEGVHFNREGCIDLHRYGWDESDPTLMADFSFSGEAEWE